MTVRTYQDLIAWQKAIALVTEIYKITETFPKTEIYGLTNQIRRSAVSVPSNIAEGQGRASSGEFRHFLGIARGSLLELETQIIIARNLQFLSSDNAEHLLSLIKEVSKVLYGLIGAMEERGPDR